MASGECRRRYRIPEGRLIVARRFDAGYAQPKIFRPEGRVTHSTHH
jgi:hypothetical protein